VPQTWDTCRRCGTLIRAQAPVVAAAATVRAPAPPRPAPTLPPLTPRGAAPPPPLPATRSAVPAPPPARAPAPADDLLPPSSAASAPAASVPAAPGDLLPLPAPGTIPGRSKKKSGFFASLDPRFVVIGAAAVVAVLGIWYALLRDPGSNAELGPPLVDVPTDAVEGARDAAAGLELQTAMATASNLALQTGSYATLTVESLSAAEPGITFVAADQPAGPGEVSVRPIDAQSIVLATSTPDGSCRAIYQSPPGAVDLIPPGPCSADSVPIGGEGRGTSEEGIPEP
jgi:hypothetical protein